MGSRRITPWYRFKKRNARRGRGGMFVWWTLVPWLLIPLARLVYGFRIRHRSRCPRTGPVLAICNHQSMLDPMMAGLALRERGFRPIARKSLQWDLKPLMAWLLMRYDMIFVDTEVPGASTFKDLLTELKEGRVGIIFPEGARSEDGCVHEFGQGVWLLIRRGRSPVLPMAVEGVTDVMPPGRGIRRTGRLEIICGDPLDPEELIAMGRDACLEHLRLLVDDLRMQLRSDIRRRTRGKWPKPGPADQSLRDTLRSSSEESSG